MHSKRYGGAVLIGVLAWAAATQAQTPKQFKYTVGPGAAVTVINDYGPVTVRAGAPRQVIINATAASNKVEVDGEQSGGRVNVRTHALQRGGENENRVEYQVTVPADASVTVRTSNGAVTAEKLRGDLSLEADTGSVEVRDVSGSHVHVRTINGPVSLTNISNGHVEITSVSGNVTLNNVSGPKVAVNTNRGNIKFDGDLGGSGEYTLVNNSGDIEFTAPATASMDITAHSVTGSVQNDFPLQQKTHTSFASQPGRAFTGTSNAGSSTVELRSFSGKIRVSKR